jgi:competence protein ComEC
VAGTLLGCALAALLLPALLRPRPPAPPAADALRVSFLDIGQGDATLLQAGRHAVLVDAGPPGGPVLRRLGSEGVRALDLLVATHAQADHLGASAAVLRAMPVGAVLDGRDGVREAWGSAMAVRARERRVPLLAPHAGSELRAGALRLKVLWPPRADGPPAAGEDPNDRAIVLLAEAAGVRVLLTADAESPVLARLALPPVDVLKVSHHGSEDDGLPALLQRLRPRLAVIEVGDGNTYGHPTPQTLRALSLAGVRTLRTDRDGTVRVDAAGGRLRVQAGA